MNAQSGIKRKSVRGFIWKLLQSSSSQFISLLISIVLARILTPEDYGVVALTTVFTNITLILVDTGFTSSLVQKESLQERDISTMLVASFCMGTILYLLLFMFSPAIAAFYNNQELVDLMRVNSLIVLFGALYSVPQALVTRNLEFKKSFNANLVASVLQGATGIVLALAGLGAWALVFSGLLFRLAYGIGLWVQMERFPVGAFSLWSFKEMFSFSSKVLASNVADSLYNNFLALLIGKQFSSSDLAYYQQGVKFPSLIMQQVDGSISTVLFSSLSRLQSDAEVSLGALRSMIRASLFVCTPIMAILFVAADPIVIILLTDKWEESIVFLQLAAAMCSLWPLSARKNALNAAGKSGVSLVLTIVSVCASLAAILFTYTTSIFVMVASTFLAEVVCQLAYIFVYSHFLGYRVRDQLIDILPPYCISCASGMCGILAGIVQVNDAATLCIQVVVCTGTYLTLSRIFNKGSLVYIIDLVRGLFKK